MQWHHRRSNHISRQAQSRAVRNYYNVNYVRKISKLLVIHQREIKIFQSLHTPKESVTESWESQLPSSTNTIRNNLKLLDSTDILTTIQDTAIASRSIKEKHTQDYCCGEKCNGIIGVPITFLDKFNPNQFEIIGSDGYTEFKPIKTYSKKEKVVDGKRMKSNTGTLGCVIKKSEFGKGTYFDVGYPVMGTYKRLFIRRK